MKLFERLNLLIDQRYDRSAAKLAEKLDLHPNTFRGYLSAEGQDKIKFSLLTRTLEITPHLCREWLLFGEGPMFQKEAVREAVQPVGTVSPTPVADTIRDVEIAIRRRGISEQGVWAAVYGLARERMGHPSEPDTETDKRGGSDKCG